jgi:Tol biopolymer transport system component
MTKTLKFQLPISDRAWATCCGVLLLISFALVELSGSYQSKPKPTPTLQLPCGTQQSQPTALGHNKIAFASRTNWGNYEICIMDADGSDSYTLTRNGRDNLTQAWSHDNKQILFEAGSGWDTSVYKINVDGSNQAKVSQTHRAIGGDWSPDGKRIVYTENAGPYPAHIVNADGTNDTELAPLGGNSRPRWSPDGRRLLFWSARDGKGVQIYAMGIDSTILFQLTNQGYNSDPAWSPDGAKIIFVSDRDYIHPPTPTSLAAAMYTGTPLQGVYQLYIMNADGSNVRKLTQSGDNFHPSWSADGTRIAFDRMVGNNHQIFVIDTDGANLIQLTHRGDNYRPVWSH